MINPIKQQARISELEKQVHELSGELTCARYENEELREKLGRALKAGAPPAMNGLITMALDSLGGYKLEAYRYFQDAIAALPPLELVEMRLRKQTAANLPDGWEVEKGGCVVLGPDGGMLGKIPPDVVILRDVRTSRHYRGYVIPPSGGINSDFEPYILL